VSFVLAGAERPTLVRTAAKRDPRCSWQGLSRRVGSDVGNERTESRSFLQPLGIPSVIRSDRRTPVVIIDEMVSCCAVEHMGVLI